MNRPMFMSENRERKRNIGLIQLRWHDPEDFVPNELNEIERILKAYRENIMDAWQKEQRKNDNR